MLQSLTSRDNEAVRLLGCRRLDAPPYEVRASWVGAVEAVHGQAVVSSPPSTEVTLVDAKTQLLRDGVNQTLLRMRDEAYRQAEPERPKLPRWVRALRLLPQRAEITPKSVSVIERLRLILAEGAPRPALDIKECARLSLEMEALARMLPQGPFAELSQRLALLGQAAWAQLARAEAEAQLLPQFRRFDQPGSSQERRAGVSLGVGLGLGEAGAGTKATFGVSLGVTWGMDNDDEGFVFVNRSKAVSAQATGKGGVGVAALSGLVQGRWQHTESEEFASATAYVQINADQLARGSRRETLGTAARAAVGALIRLFRPGYGNELSHFQRLQQQAADQQQRLGVLLGWLGQRNRSEALPGPARHYAPPCIVDSVRGDACVRAEAAGVGVGLGVAVERIDIKAPVLTPFWQALRQEHGVARKKKIAEQRLAGLGQMAGVLFGPDAKTRPLSRLSGAADAEALRSVDLKTLARAVDCLAAEFEHLCAVAQQVDAGIGRRACGAAVERSLLASWRARSREEALAQMALAHAVLVREVAAREPAEAAVDMLFEKRVLDQRLDELAPRLYAPPIRYDAGKLAQATSFRDLLKLQIRDRSLALSLGGALGEVGLQVSASLTERERLHHNPLRAGDYKDVRVSLTGSVGGSWPLDRVRDALAAQLAAHGLAAEVPAALAGLQASLGAQGSGSLMLLLRFYRPQYQRQADFPADAAGYRLQLIRVSAGGDVGLSLAGGVPVQPGVSVELGLDIGTSATSVLYERWGDNSLSAPLMHYLHLKAVGEEARWLDKRQEQRQALEALCRQLARPDSAVRGEANYFLKRQQWDGTRFFAVVEAFAAGHGSFEAAIEELEALMERQYPQWQIDKQDFAGWEELSLTHESGRAVSE
ncbi:hypothetical protein C2134_00705 [Chromobacterium sinusclupearum]|uniref:Uncharacterized protein n=1 Tax=Chromobacterium sinusclupearum TaxID=2077146 RepID=A0A2K4MU24_9NEIS|nr:hypothetical protein [Chromobacterium sinusclupearum]POB00622.1 hypothetical protein C2134_00705 [Chromobacterium sinusclupearum]